MSNEPKTKDSVIPLKDLTPTADPKGGIKSIGSVIKSPVKGVTP